MIDVVSKATLRGKRQAERTKMMAAAKPKGVRVTPANDDMRRVIKHPHSGNFPKTGSAEWPNDRFTKRRIADGSIKLDEKKPDDKKHDDKSPPDKKPRFQSDEPSAA